MSKEQVLSKWLTCQNLIGARFVKLTVRISPNFISFWPSSVNSSTGRSSKLSISTLHIQSSHWHHMSTRAQKNLCCYLGQKIQITVLGDIQKIWVISVALKFTAFPNSLWISVLQYKTWSYREQTYGKDVISDNDSQEHATWGAHS